MRKGEEIKSATPKKKFVFEKIVEADAEQEICETFVQMGNGRDFL